MSITRRKVIWSLLAAAVAVIVVCWQLLPPAPEELRYQQATQAIAQFRAWQGEDADIILLEDAIAPLGVEGVEVLTNAVESSGDLRLMQVFDGLDPETTTAAMRRLRTHRQPEIRHGALLMLGRTGAVSRDEWQAILEDAGEDRFIRQLAAHQLRGRRWWEGLDPGVQPAAPGGISERRVTYLRRESSFGELCDEFAWVTGQPATCPPEVRAEPLRNVYYWQVQLRGMLGDLRFSEGYDLHRFEIDDAGAVTVRRIYAEDR